MLRFQGRKKKKGNSKPKSDKEAGITAFHDEATPTYGEGPSGRILHCSLVSSCNLGEFRQPEGLYSGLMLSLCAGRSIYLILGFYS